MERRVVVTGLGVITSLGQDADSLWSALCAGRSGVGALTLVDSAPFSTKIAAEVRDVHIPSQLNLKAARRMDRFALFALLAAIQAVEDAALAVNDSVADDIGVLVGSGRGGEGTVVEQLGVLSRDGLRRVSPFFIPKIIGNMAAAQISIHYGLHGPSFSVVSACATGSHAIGEAAELIRRGDAEVMIAGAADAPITQVSLAGFEALGALSRRNHDPAGASRPFDAERDGFVIAEGAGIVVLEERRHAERRGVRIYAEVSGYGATSDGSHVTEPAPDGRQAARAMARALKKAGLGPGGIDYINAHGTSTPIGDHRETQAIKVVFGERSRSLPISSTKSMTGHLLGASGAVETVICVKALQEQVIPPTINQEHSDPECDLDYVPNVARKAELQHVMSNSFGFGGHNASLVVSLPV